MKEINITSQKLVTVLSLLENKDEIQNFLSDLLTQKEISEFSRRLEVAELLFQKVSYKKIEEKTDMSSTTIARISKFVSSDNWGYQKALQLLKSISDKHHVVHRS